MEIKPGEIKVSVTDLKLFEDILELLIQVKGSLPYEAQKHMYQRMEELIGETHYIGDFRPEPDRESILYRCLDFVSFYKNQPEYLYDYYYENHAGKKTLGGTRAKIEFVVDRKEKSVAALIKAYYFKDKIMASGSYSFLEGDCFNEHLGKAIALKEAMGKKVPNEWLNIPQPNRVKEGNLVMKDGWSNPKTVSSKSIPLLSANSLFENGELKIIDDSIGGL
jgi:hypothetical protein